MSVLGGIIGCALGLLACHVWVNVFGTNNKISNKITNQKVGDRCTAISGGNINIANGEIIVDGEVVESGLKKYHFTVNIEGNCETVTTSQGTINVYGSVTNNVKTSQGSITVTEGIGGNATTSQGSIKCGGNIGGNAKTTMGNIKYRK